MSCELRRSFPGSTAYPVGGDGDAYRCVPEPAGREYAVVHTHQPYASTFTLINEAIPALFDEQVANLGSRVDMVPYGMSGTAELMENIAANLDNQCNAYLLQNHGVLCLGMTLDKAALNVLLMAES